MFSVDRWQEIAESLGRNRFRTLVTALSVSWGIFMLVILLGVGQGLENATRWQFRDDATNSLWMFAGKTTLPFQGQAVGRTVTFTNDDFDQISELERVDHATGRFRRWTNSIVRYRDRSSSFGIRSVHPDHQFLEMTQIISGRFLNDLDISERRKVVVIGIEVSKYLFRGADPIGEWVEIGGLQYKVVGVFEDMGSVGEMRQVYIPITTAQVAYNGVNSMAMIMVTVGESTAAQATILTEDVRRLLARKHKFDPNDKRALRVRNNVERFEQVSNTFSLLSGFVWLVGLGTITAGIVGVSNIMLVSVSERTREIGLRKALGATPGSIIALIMQEAIVLTSISGYAGLVAGVSVLELMIRYLPENDYVRDPEVNFGAALVAMALLVFFGALAGFFPAARAAAVRPIDALRSE
jgi:putative ABC transport system permease protein